jgi:hypothetical protein
MPQKTLKRRGWELVVLIITFTLCSIGLLGISIFSFFQTLVAFAPMADPTTSIAGWKIGLRVPIMFAFVFQYGQNVALYLRDHFASRDVVATIPLGNRMEWNITPRDAWLAVFIICATIDAGTNCVWLHSQPKMAGVIWWFQILLYMTMIAIVGVEEIFGITVQGLFHAWKELATILSVSIRRNPAVTTSKQSSMGHSFSPVHRPAVSRSESMRAHDAITETEGTNFLYERRLEELRKKFQEKDA